MLFVKKASMLGILIGIGFMTAAGGFIVAALSGDRSIGYSIFMLGFFLGAGAAVALTLTRASAPTGVKIGACGFGVILLGQLVHITFEVPSVSDASFWIGGIIMLIGGVVHGVRILTGETS